MTTILIIFLIFNTIMLFHSLDRLARMKLARVTLENLNQLYKAGIISEIQAKVYLNEMDDPMNAQAILAVYHELREIHEKHQNSNR